MGLFPSLWDKSACRLQSRCSGRERGPKSKSEIHYIGGIDVWIAPGSGTNTGFRFIEELD